MPYTKLFNSIITSSLWMEPDHTRIVWITMLALADKNGEVQASVPGLARLAGVPVESCRVALTALTSPDPDSRTKVLEGRRIVEIDGGWELVNHAKYRRMASEEDAREANAKRQSRHRARAEEVTENNGMSLESNAPVTPLDHKQSTEAKADAEAKPIKKKKAAAPLKILTADILPLLTDEFRNSSFMEAWAGFVEHRKSIKASLTDLAVKRFASDFTEWGCDRSVFAINKTIKSGKWSGIFYPEDFRGVTSTKTTPREMTADIRAEQERSKAACDKAAWEQAEDLQRMLEKANRPPCAPGELEEIFEE